MAVKETESVEETETEETETEETEEDETGEGESGESGDGDSKKKDPELERAIKTRDRAKNEVRRLREELAKAKNPDEKPDPVAVANRRLVTSSARAVLAASGVTDKADQRAVIGMLDLSGIEVDDEDGPDEDEIEERISELRRIFGAGKAPKKRMPSSVNPKDRGGAGAESDPDRARYRRILGG